MQIKDTLKRNSGRHENKENNTKNRRLDSGKQPCLYQFSLSVRRHTGQEDEVDKNKKLFGRLVVKSRDMPLCRDQFRK